MNYHVADGLQQVCDRLICSFMVHKVHISTVNFDDYDVADGL